MIDVIVQFFSSIVDFLKSLVDLAVTGVTSMFDVVPYLTTAAATAVSSMAVMPAFVKVGLSGMASIVVLWQFFDKD